MRFVPAHLWRLSLFALLGVILLLALGPKAPVAIDTGWDKANHLLAFAALGWVAAQAYASRWRWLALLGYGVLIELLQALTPHRYASALDVLADAAGLVLAAVALWAWQRFKPSALA
jgi:VanZ family protein